MHKGIIFAASFLAVAAIAAPASALQVVKYEIPNKVQAHVSGPGVSGNFWMGLGELTFAGMGIEEVFCIDPWHNITLGTFSPALNYALGDAHTGLSVNSPGVGTLKEIAYLVNFGIASNNSFIEQAVAGAIWSKEGMTVTVANPLLQTKISELAAWSYKVGYDPQAFFSIDKKIYQGFMPGGAVPEPATWAMLVVGFGLAGVAMRRRDKTGAIVSA